MTITIVGVDTAKSAFRFTASTAPEGVVLRKRISRNTFLAEMARLPRCVIGLEVGYGAQHWARERTAFGHHARLMPPKYVRPYVKRNKHDAADAEACCEAVQRPGMRFVPGKSVEQQSTMMLHRVRDHFIRRRTGAVNALRGHLAEFGLVASSQRAGLNRLLEIVEAADDCLPAGCAELLSLITAEIRSNDTAIQRLDRKLKDKARSDEVSRLRSAIPGIGPVIATAIPATWPRVAGLLRGATSRPGSVSRHGSIRVAGASEPTGYPNAVTPTWAASSSTARKQSSGSREGDVVHAGTG